MIKTAYFIFITIFLLSCTPTQNNFETEIDFDDVLNDQNMSDSEKIIELKIALSRQEDQITSLENNLDYFEAAFDSLEVSNKLLISYLESQIDSFRIFDPSVESSIRLANFKKSSTPNCFKYNAGATAGLYQA